MPVAGFRRLPTRHGYRSHGHAACSALPHRDGDGQQDGPGSEEDRKEQNGETHPDRAPRQAGSEATPAELSAEPHDSPHLREPTVGWVSSNDENQVCLSALRRRRNAGVERARTRARQEAPIPWAVRESGEVSPHDRADLR